MSSPSSLTLLIVSTLSIWEKTMNKLSKIICCCTFGLCFAVCSSNCSADNFSEFVSIIAVPNNSNSSIKTNEPKLTLERQKFIKKYLNLLLDDDFEGFNKGLLGIFDNYLQKKYGYKIVTAEEMFNTYDKNQIKGDKEYINQKLIVRGKIEQIKSSVGNKPVIYLKAGKNVLLSTVHALFKNPDNDIDKIIELEKNTNIVLLCVGRGVIVNSPIVDDCEFADKYKAEYKKYFNDTIDSFINGTPKEGLWPTYFFIAVYIISLEEPAFMDSCNKNNCSLDKKINSKFKKIMDAIHVSSDKYSKLKPQEKALTDKYRNEIWKLLVELKIVDPVSGNLIVDDFILSNW